MTPSHLHQELKEEGYNGVVSKHICLFQLITKIEGGMWNLWLNCAVNVKHILSEIISKITCQEYSAIYSKEQRNWEM